ncbi:MAG: hypothetical protein D6702_01495 [Planctomycetota bacterium]|nr:MAG: hypothetical protein D6702_01495 [Planctomycetota bacterium]
MSGRGRLIGWAVAAGALVFGGRLLVRRPAPPTVDEPPAGFVLELEDLGRVELGIRGPVEILIPRPAEEPAGAGRSVPRLRIAGRDPRPEEGGMRLRSVVLTAFAEDGATTAWRIEAPSARVALAAGESVPRPDPARPWSLESPRLSRPDPQGEQVLSVAAAELWPDQRRIQGHGLFSLQTGGLLVRGEDLAFDLARGEARFGEGGALTWSFPLASGERAEGGSDGGGALRRLEDGGRRLELPARERCELVLPPGSGLAGTFRCRGLVADFAPDGGGAGWIPRVARGLGPAAWSGLLADRRPAAVFGRDATLVWADGRLLGLDLLGPLQAFRRTEDDSASWLAARGGAWIETRPAPEGADPPGPVLALRGGVLGQEDGRRFEADRFRLEDGHLLAEGAVALEDGRIQADRFEAFPDGRRRLDGAVVFRPTDGVGLGAPWLEMAAADPLKPDYAHFRAGGGVLTRTTLRGAPAVMRSEALEAQGFLEGDRGLRLDARRNVVIDRGGARMRGDHFAFHGESGLELRGRPAGAEMPRLAPDGSVLGRATVRADRLIWFENEVIPSGSPQIEWPAKEFGLDGETIRLRADHGRFAADGSSALLRGEVRADGALELTADTVRMRTDEDGRRLLDLVPLPQEQVRLRGALLRPEGGPLRFDLRAGGMVIDPTARTARLDRGAETNLDAGDGRLLRLTGRRAEVGPDAGVFERGASFEKVAADAPEGAAETLRGGAERLAWRRTEDGGLELDLTAGGAWLEAGRLRGEGDRIRLEARPAADGVLEPARLELEGGESRPARLRLPDGRILEGAWFRYNFRTRLHESGPVRLLPGNDHNPS